MICNNCFWAWTWSNKHFQISQIAGRILHNILTLIALPQSELRSQIIWLLHLQDYAWLYLVHPSLPSLPFPPIWPRMVYYTSIAFNFAHSWVQGHTESKSFSLHFGQHEITWSIAPIKKQSPFGREHPLINPSGLCRSSWAIYLKWCQIARINWPESPGPCQASSYDSKHSSWAAETEYLP